jgi:hypothetical protein
MVKVILGSFIYRADPEFISELRKYLRKMHAEGVSIAFRYY